MPASPGFYSRPQKIEELTDFMAGRALSLMGVQNNLYPVWEG
jgi:flavin prenyltransferase